MEKAEERSVYREIPNVLKMLETVAGEICDGYCKWADGIDLTDDEETQSSSLKELHCINCPIGQFIGGIKK